MPRLQNRFAVITGAGSGIGRATAVRFAAEGARVAILDMNADGLRETDAACGGGCLAIPTDVTDDAALEAAAGIVEREFGALHVLFANAGIATGGTIQGTTREIWDKTLAVNLTGSFRTIQTFYPLLQRAEGHRAIIATASVQALRGTGWTIPYDASKAGITGMIRAVAHQSSAEGITANAIAPGPIETNMLSPGLNEQNRPRLEQRVALGRLGQGEDIAGVALFFASDDSRFVTGQVLTVDGGMTMNAPGKMYKR